MNELPLPRIGRPVGISFNRVREFVLVADLGALLVPESVDGQ